MVLSIKCHSLSRPARWQRAYPGLNSNSAPQPSCNALRALTTRAGTLLAIDETHTLVTAYAGLAQAWVLRPDLLTLGKSIAAGVPLGAYGMTDAVAAKCAVSGRPVRK